MTKTKTKTKTKAKLTIELPLFDGHLVCSLDHDDIKHLALSVADAVVKTIG